MNLKIRTIDTRFLKSEFFIELLISVIAGLSAFLWALFFSSETALIDSRINLKKKYLENIKKTSNDNNIAIVVIPENVLIRYNHPDITPRGYLAGLVDCISELEPKVIALDYIFDQPSNKSDDELLIKSIKNAENIVVGYQMVETIGGYKCGITDTLLLFKSACYGAGYTNIGKDENEVARYFNFSLGSESSFVCEILTCFFRKEASRLIENQFLVSNETRDFFLSQYNLPSSVFYNDIFINYDNPLNHKSFDIHESDEIIEISKNNKEFLKAIFKDKIVLIGDSGYNRDIHKIPLKTGKSRKESFGVLIQANILKNFIDKNFIYKTNLLIDILILIFFIFISFIAAYFLNLRRFLIFFLIEIAGYVFTAFILFLLFNILMPIILIISFVTFISLSVMMVRVAYSEKIKSENKSGIYRDTRKKGKKKINLFEKF